MKNRILAEVKKLTGVVAGVAAGAMMIGWAHSAPAATNDASMLLQNGLFEEEANHNLDAAVADYLAVVAQTEKDHAYAATAVFRLGECYRKMGRTNDANIQYQRVLREFADQTELAKLSREYLGPAAMAATTSKGAAEDVQVVNPEAATLDRIKAMIADSPDLLTGAEGSRELQNAVGANWLSVAAFLIEHHVNVNGSGNDGEPIFHAASDGSREMTEFLLNHGAGSKYC